MLLALVLGAQISFSGELVECPAWAETTLSVATNEALIIEVAGGPWGYFDSYGLNPRLEKDGYTTPFLDIGILGWGTPRVYLPGPARLIFGSNMISTNSGTNSSWFPAYVYGFYVRRVPLANSPYQWVLLGSRSNGISISDTNATNAFISIPAGKKLLAFAGAMSNYSVIPTNLVPTNGTFVEAPPIKFSLWKTDRVTPNPIYGPADVQVSLDYWAGGVGSLAYSLEDADAAQPGGSSGGTDPQALAANTNFLQALASNLIIASNSHGLATKGDLALSVEEGRASGIASVLSNPNQWTLFTTNQIKNMAVGDLVLTRTNGSGFVLNYDIEQSEDLVNWAPYQGFAMPLTNLPTNKAFLRLKIKE
ncbi:MAG: hypothetical protein EBZ78_08350 [Verrucomicrobia bacterium]|nr:hypothetical protein [Verrucomicrobiota bacterium]